MTPGCEWELELPAPYERLLARLPLPTADVLDEAAAIGVGCTETLRVLADLGAVEDCVVDGTGRAVLVARRPRLTGRGPGREPLRLHEHAFLRPAFPGSPDFPGWVLRCAGLPTTMRADASAVDLGRLGAGAIAASAEELGPVDGVLLDAGFLVEDGTGPDESVEFHDAVFHAVSALGDTAGGGYGARPEPRGRPSGQPATGAPAGCGPSAALRTPPLHEVLAARRTCRDFTAEPLPPAAVDGLLALALRARGRHPQAPECVLHAYPSAGARDEITTVVASTYPHPALSRYLHERHALQPLDATAEHAREVVRVLGRPCGIVDPLPALGLVFAADYHRVAAKYEAIAYANVLRNVGAIYQTVSLAATAMGLGSCAVGGGWGQLERRTLAGLLGGRLIVGAMLIGIPAAAR